VLPRLQDNFVQPSPMLLDCLLSVVKLYSI
jgi:hypothetical protein